MRLILIFLLSLITIPELSVAQKTPREGAVLNYRIIGFSFPIKEKAENYRLQISSGNFNKEKDFDKNVIIDTQINLNKLIISVPSFGKQYTWRVSYGKKTGALNHFSTAMAPPADTTQTRMRIITPAEKYKDCYVFTDCNKTLYDMQGNPVWFFPEIENRKQATFSVRDLKTNLLGTITAIVNCRLYEMDYDGNILWTGPDNNLASLDTLTSDNGYHHEFTRIANGHYMAMGFEEPWWPLPAKPDTTAFLYNLNKIKQEGDRYYQKMFFGTVLEYDATGKIVWKWTTGDYVKQSDLKNKMLPNGLYNCNNTHSNAFCLDEKRKTIYISFRDINRVIQVSYPSGELLHTYGKLNSAGRVYDRRLTNGVFCGQHSCRSLSDDGSLYLYNNNACNRNSMPEIVRLKLPPDGVDTVEKVWDWECTLEPGEEKKDYIYSYGGNVIELKNHDMFVCIGGTYGKMLIVSEDKKILWSAQTEKWDISKKQWIKEGVMINNITREGSYRASIITHDELERIIWGGK